MRGERFDVLGLVEHETRLLALYGTIPFIDETLLNILGVILELVLGLHLPAKGTCSYYA